MQLFDSTTAPRSVNDKAGKTILSRRFFWIDNPVFKLRPVSEFQPPDFEQLSFPYFATSQSAIILPFL